MSSRKRPEQGRVSHPPSIVPTTSMPNKALRRKRLLVCLTAGILIAGVALGWWSSRGVLSSTQLLSAAKQAFSKKEYAEAERLATAISPDQSEWAAALVIAGDAAARQQHYQRAVSFYEQVPEEAEAEFRQILISLALVHRELGHYAQSESALRQLLRLDPRHLPAHNALAHLLGVAGRSWEAVPHLLEAVRQGQFQVSHLLLLGSTAPIVQDADFVSRCLREKPDDWTPLIGDARQRLFESQDIAGARKILEQIVARSPEQIEAQARLGWILLDDEDHRQWDRWHDQLGSRGDWHPEIWSVRSSRAHRQQQLQEAVRCCWEVLQRDPDHAASCFQMGLLLQLLQRHDDAREFLQRGELLNEFSERIGTIQSGQADAREIRAIAELAEQLGRYWEAWGWSRLLAQAPEHQGWADQLAQRIQPDLADRAGRTVAQRNPAAAHDFSAWPLPRGSAADEARPQTELLGSTAAGEFQFRDISQDVGFDFTYLNGTPRGQSAGRMYEFTGGGAAIVDIDADQWPDVWMTQGTEEPPSLNDPPEPSRKVPTDSDRLYRNRMGLHMQDVTELAGVQETEFSQGVTAGDFDNDGFTDVYVANLGVNRLFHNNGDGTFSEITSHAGSSGSHWSTSALLADLSGDQLPDLFVVNYLTGADVFTRVCNHSSGIPAGCGPEHFSGAADQVFLNDGQGQFIEPPGVLGDQRSPGKGMGIVAADFDGQSPWSLELLIANDGMANHFYVPAPSANLSTGNPASAAASAGHSIHRPGLIEQGLVCGLAFDWQGRPQAGMGIAAGDANGDGLLDAFVTNYYRESNTLYTQRGPRLFEDTSRWSGLSQPSYLMLGFGTQFLDADLDGWSDLVVANGHVHNLKAADIPFEMRPQLFHNQGAGDYQEVQQAGDYFSRPRLGRSLARLDWNRDLRDDFVVSHLYDRSSLVANSRASGHAVGLHLRGTHVSRDAIGAVVHVTVQGTTRLHQLTAGDGYQASNERKLTIGLGTADFIDQIDVTWPGGHEQVFRDIPSGTELLLLEGRDRWIDVSVR